MADENPQSGAAGAQDQQQTGQFGIQKIYVKDLSFESPNAPVIFTEKWAPNVDLQLGSSSERISENVYQVLLTLTVTVKQEEKTAFLIEVQQAGVFTIQGFDKDLGPLLGSYCPNVLFPFARETVADIVSRGGFPQLLLAPVNFDALYAQHVQRQQAEQAGKAEQPQGAPAGQTSEPH
jgi:preprotein translocase subunit SecB